jgi:hypothetical protein
MESRVWTRIRSTSSAPRSTPRRTEDLGTAAIDQNPQGNAAIPGSQVHGCPGAAEFLCPGIVLNTETPERQRHQPCPGHTKREIHIEGLAVQGRGDRLLRFECPRHQLVPLLVERLDLPDRVPMETDSGIG